MPKVRTLPYNPDDVEAGGNFIHFQPLPSTVKVKCTAADLEFQSKAGDEGMHLQFQILAKPPKKPKGAAWSTLHQYVMFAEGQEWKEVETLEALLGKRPKKFKAADLVGKTCMAKLREEPYEGEPTAKIARLINLDLAEEDDDLDDDEDPDDVDPDDADDDDDDDEEENYNDWTLAQLNKELTRRELETSGKKKDKVARLEEDDASDDEKEVDYSDWDLKELKAEMRKRGLKVPRGSEEDDLIEALEEDDEDESDPLGDDDDDDDD